MMSSEQGGERESGSSEVRRFALEARHVGQRLDHVLVEFVPEWSRTRLQGLIKGDQVRVGDAVIRRPNHLVEEATTVEIALPRARPLALDVTGAPIETLPVLYEDDDILVIDKPAGLASHPKHGPTAGPKAAPHPLGAARPEGAPLSSAVYGGLSVSDLAAAQFGALPVGQGLGRAGIVHRLDRLTSGVMVLARTAAAMEDLMRQFRHRTVAKTYLAIVYGEPRFDSQWIEAPLAANPKSPDRQRVASQAQIDSGEARDAETFVEVRERFPGFALLACHPKTGRTHQIRVHLQHLGHPLVGDRIYHARGTPKVPLPADPRSTSTPPSTPMPARQALHAETLELDHPRTRERQRYTAPLPSDLCALLAWLRTRSEA